MRTHQLNARRRRARKSQLAARDGAHCAYCRAPFTDLKHATLDHVVPIRLLRTWSAAHLVLACRPCNQAKADCFPLLMALLLIGAVDGVEDPAVHPASTLDRSTAWAGTSPLIESGGHTVDGVDTHLFTDVFTLVDLRLLARLAHARQSIDRTAIESGGRSGVHQGVHRAHDGAHCAHGGTHNAHDRTRYIHGRLHRVQRSTRLCASRSAHARSTWEESA